MEKIIGREEFENLLRLKMTPENAKLVMKAYRLSKAGHREQEREDGTRYFEHPKAVALIIIKEFEIYDYEVIITALLHDEVEDTFIFGAGEEAFETIRDDFGKRVESFVRLLSKPPCEESKKAQRDCEYYNNLFSAPLEPRILKIADRIHNLRTLRYCDLQKQDRKLLETSVCVWRIAESIAAERNDIFKTFSKTYQEARESFNAYASGRIVSDV